MAILLYAARSAHLKSSWTPMRARHAHHVAKSSEDYIWLSRDREAVVDASDGQHAHRTARPVNQIDIFGQHILQSKAINGMRVAAVDSIKR
jgi:hypothetical protein